MDHMGNNKENPASEPEVAPARENKKAKTAKTKVIPPLSKKKFGQQFESVLLNLRQERVFSEDLYEELKNIQNEKLNVIYEIVDRMKHTAKDEVKLAAASALTSSVTTATKKTPSKPLLINLTGSINRVLSDVISINREQKELFQSILKVKLVEPSASVKNLPLKEGELKAVGGQIDSLLRNLTTLRKELARGLKMVYGKSSTLEQGKGWTLEHGKDLKNPHQLSLQQECARLLIVLDKQIAMNNTLKEKLGLASPQVDVQSYNNPKKP
jgi:hypothetical protein